MAAVSTTSEASIRQLESDSGTGKKQRQTETEIQMQGLTRGGHQESEVDI